MTMPHLEPSTAHESASNRFHHDAADRFHRDAKDTVDIKPSFTSSSQPSGSAPPANDCDATSPLLTTAISKLAVE